MRIRRIQNTRNKCEMLSQALVFLSVGVIAGLPSLAGITGVGTQISCVLLLVGIVLLAIHLVRGNRLPPA